MNGMGNDGMNDTQAIQQTISRYAIGCSAQDWDSVIATFTADGAWEVPSRGLRITGHDALRAAMSGFVAGFDHFVQINAPAAITVDGDRATARSLIRECGKYTGRDEALEVTGLYDDELLRTADGWKFERRTFTGLGMLGLPTAAPTLPG